MAPAGPSSLPLVGQFVVARAGSHGRTRKAGYGELLLLFVVKGGSSSEVRSHSRHERGLGSSLLRDAMCGKDGKCCPAMGR